MPKTKTKTHAFWCVVDNTGCPIERSFRELKSDSIYYVCARPDEILKWKELKKIGYTCQKFTITTKIK